MQILTNNCSTDLQTSKDFYVDLLDFEINYDSDWYVQLCLPQNREFEYGIIQRDHQLVPEEYRQAPSGMYVTFVVADVDAVYARAVAMALPIIQQPRNEFYGQRRMLLADPDGCLLDICSPWQAE